MDELYAALGRKQLALERLHREYDTLLHVLGQVVAGAIDPARVTVNPADRAWTVAPIAAEAPALPIH